MPNLEELLNHIPIELSKAQNEPLWISKVAYGQLKLSKETCRPCDFVITGGNRNGYYRFKKGFYSLPEIPTIFHGKRDRTLNYHTIVFLDDILIATRKDKKHGIKLFTTLEKL